MWCPTKNLGLIGSAVLTFIGYKQTNKQTDKQNLYIDYKDTRIQRYNDIAIWYKNTKKQGNKDTRIQGYRGYRGYKNTRIEYYKNTEMQGYKKSTQSWKLMKLFIAIWSHVEKGIQIQGYKNRDTDTGALR